MRRSTFSVAAGTIAALTMTLPALAQQTDDRYWHGPGMMWGGGYMGGFGMFFGFIFMILILAALVLGIVWLLRAMGVVDSVGGTRSAGTPNKALDILKERFAKGEIDAQEFDERKRLLGD